MRWSHAASLGLVLMTASFLTGCSTVEGVGATRANAHPLSFQLKDEKVELSAKFAKPKNQAAPEVAGAAISIGLGLAVDLIRDGLEKEAARYNQEYAGSRMFEWRAQAEFQWVALALRRSGAPVNAGRRDVSLENF